MPPVLSRFRESRIDDAPKGCNSGGIIVEEVLDETGRVELTRVGVLLATLPGLADPIGRRFASTTAKAVMMPEPLCGNA